MNSSTTRLQYTIRNAKWTLVFSIIILFINFFSRSVFIEFLGSEYLGLVTTIVSYIGFLNMAELGIDVAITQALYKPIFEGNRQRINEVMSLLGFLFRWVGVVIFVGAMILALFIPTIFENSGIPISMIFFTFFAFLSTTLMSYWVNYKQTIVIAAQHSYAITILRNSILALKFLTQMGTLYYLDLGYKSWLMIEVVYSICYALWLEIYVRRNFSWVQINFKQGGKLLKTEKTIYRNVKNIFSKRIAITSLLESDNIIIQNILGVAQVTYYTNYTMIMNRTIAVFTSLLGSSNASIGNLVSSGDKVKTKQVYNQYFILFYWVGAILMFSFYNFISPFIDLWLPAQQTYNQEIVFLISINFFMAIVYRPFSYFLTAYGLFADAWIIWLEMVLNLVISIVLTIYFGIIGVVIGTAVSTTLVSLLWKPYYLFSQGFQESFWSYLKSLIKYIAITLVSWIATELIVSLINPQTVVDNTWLELIYNISIKCGIFILILSPLMYLFSSAMRSLIKLWVDIVKSKYKL